MSARVGSPVALMVLSSILSFAPAAAGPWALAPREFFVDFRGGFSSAETYHDQLGQRQALFHGGTEEMRSLASYVEMGWKKRLSVAFGIPMLSVSRVPDVAPGSPTATGFADGLLGLRYNLANGRTGMTVQLDWRPPLGYRRASPTLSRADSILCGDTNGDGDSLDTNCARQSGRARLGEGVQEVTLALHVGRPLPFWTGFMQVSGGYRYRFEDTVEQVVATADIALWVRPALLVSGRYTGEFAAANTDRETDKVSRQRVGPLLLCRVTPSLDLFAGSFHTASAYNAIHTDEVYVGLSMRHTGLNRLQGYLGGVREP